MSSTSPSAVIVLDDGDDGDGEMTEGEKQFEASSPDNKTKSSPPASVQPVSTSGKIYFYDYEEFTANITEEEKNYRQEHVLTSSELDEENIECSACSRRLDYREVGDLLAHPYLGVPLCLRCHSFYGDGDWSRGDDGFLEFCRWCANGGDLVCCDNCDNVFCKGCIQRNLGARKVSDIENSDSWHCFVCDNKPLWRLRNKYFSIWNYQKTIKTEKKKSSGFIDDALEDGLDVNKIFSDYLDKATTSWKRKAEAADEEENVKMVKKIRTILSVTHHNLRMLEQNLVDGLQKKYPHLDPETTKGSGVPDVAKNSRSQKPSAKSENTEHDESRDMFEEDEDPADHNTLNEANRKAREAVLRSSSDDDVIHISSKSPEDSPRKKLKTKKELNEMRQRQASYGEDEDSSGDDGDSSNSEKSSTTKKIFRKLNKIGQKVDLKTNQQLKQTVGVDIRMLRPEIREDLRVYEEVDVTDHPTLAEACLKAETAEIDRLCDLKSLKRGRRQAEGADRLGVKGLKGNKKNKELRLGDITSGEETDNSDDQTNSEDNRDEFQGFQVVEPRKPPLLATTSTALFQCENGLAKSLVLASSDENSPASDISDLHEDNSDSARQKGKRRKEPGQTAARRTPAKKKSALLSMKLSETDSSEAEEKHRRKMEKKKASALDHLEGDGSQDTEPEVPLSSRKKKSKLKRQAVLSSDTENGASEEEKEEEGSNYEDEDEDEEDGGSDSDNDKKKSRKRLISGDDSSDSEDKPKRRKRIKGGTSESEDENSPSKGRHDIRRIIKDKNLTESTKEAAAEERERRKRITERQALYNKSFPLPEKDKEGTVDSLVLDFDPVTMKVLVEVDKRLVKKLKPHQVNGVKFMWDACFESLEQIKSGKIPGGAILAHCMGLGKTLQTISLTQTVLQNPEVDVERVMVICPVNTVKNWQDEYDKWLTGDLEVEVYEMSKEKDNWGRADRLQQWFREGGVLIIGYEMFRNLVNEKNGKFKKRQREIFNRCLLDPGPDLVVCDEGHLLKNEKSAINKAVNRISTIRRIVLTGTPLQNNLKEYFEMVNFVKPHLLGTRKEFLNRFVNPIVNGQHADSTEKDVRVMKKRSFVLNDLLKGCMQRLDYNVLLPYLQPKHEYVLSITLTDLQKKLYKFYLENFAKAGQISDEGKLEGGKKGGLFYDVQQLSRIWNHPFILELARQRKDDKEEKDDDEEGSLKDFICDDEDEEIDSGNSESEDEDSDIQEVDSNGEALSKKPITRSLKSSDLADGLEEGGSSSKCWWNNFLKEEDQLDDIKFGNKMVLLMEILKESALIGDKVLVFSQSLLSLDLIEEFLARVNEAHESSSADNSMSEYLDSWLPGKDYYRMDGSTAADTRKIWCKYFNKPTNFRMRLFLISTKAGGLGINLVAANRVIVFDASWNPSHDIQSIFRVFRFGQTKPVYIYRFLGKGTMEEKIYERQVTKQSLSARVVDEQQIERHFTMNELAELYEFKDEPQSERPTPIIPQDRLLAELLDRNKTVVWGINNHDSLLENQVDQNLTEEERQSAWEEYEQEKKGVIQTNIGIENTQQFGEMLQGMLPRSGDGRIMASPINPMAIQMQLRQMNPELAHEELVLRTRAAILQLQNLHRIQTPVILNENTLSVGQRHTTGYDQSYYQAEMAKAKAMINQQYPGMYSFRGPSPGPGPGPHAPGSSSPGLSGPRAGPSDVITLDGAPEPPMTRMPIRAPISAPRGGARGRGGRRGRPRLDPDTDLDFSPEPSNINSAMILARLQQAGVNVSNSGAKSSNSNES